VGKKVKNCYISPLRESAISQPICTKFGEFVDLTKVLTLAKFGGFSRAGVEKSIFLLKAYGPRKLPRATMLACDDTVVYNNNNNLVRK